VQRASNCGSRGSSSERCLPGSFTSGEAHYGSQGN
jgi:hypothetical protein